MKRVHKEFSSPPHRAQIKWGSPEQSIPTNMFSSLGLTKVVNGSTSSKLQVPIKLWARNTSSARIKKLHLTFDPQIGEKNYEKAQYEKIQQAALSQADKYIGKLMKYKTTVNQSLGNEDNPGKNNRKFSYHEGEYIKFIGLNSDNLIQNKKLSGRELGEENDKKIFEGIPRSNLSNHTSQSSSCKKLPSFLASKKKPQFRSKNILFNSTKSYKPNLQVSSQDISDKIRAKAQSVNKQEHHTARQKKIPAFLKKKLEQRDDSLTDSKDNSKQGVKNISERQVKQNNQQKMKIEENLVQQETLNIQIKIKSASKRWRLSDFEIVRQIGKGSFGDAYLAVQKYSGLFVVLKVINKDRLQPTGTKQNLSREIKIQSFLSHKHLVNIYGFFQQEDKICLVLELLYMGSLKKQMNKIKCNEKAVARLVRQIAQAIKYIHLQNVIHRDIKPQNIFMHDNYVKLGDFGCAIYSLQFRRSVVGSLCYLSPQQLRKENYDKKIDIWALGILTYQLLFGECPFDADILKIACHQSDPVLSNLTFPNKNLSQEAQDFIQRLLNQNSNQRANINEVLQHRFLVSNHQEDEERHPQT